MFIGREKELKTLNDLYKTNKFQFVVLYGRRRIGKTELIKKFIKDKEAIYFVGIESNEKQNLSNLSKSIFDFENKNLISSNFESFQNALEYIFHLTSS